MQHLYYIITANLPFHAFPNLACILLAPSPPLFFVSVQINQSPASFLHRRDNAGTSVKKVFFSNSYISLTHENNLGS